MEHYVVGKQRRGSGPRGKREIREKRIKDANSAQQAREQRQAAIKQALKTSERR